jgi:micrococcal nuclease
MNKIYGLIVVGMLLVVNVVEGKELVGKVVDVVDGDGIKIDVDGKVEEVRFAHIDAWECGQARGPESYRVLKGMVDVGDDVVVEYEKVGKYGRVIGVVYKDGVNVNLKMVEVGAALWFYRYSNDTTYRDAQVEVVGETPWDYRSRVPWDVRKGHSCK